MQEVIFGFGRNCSPNEEYVILWFYIFIKTNSPSTLNRIGRISKSKLYHTSQQLSQHDCPIRIFSHKHKCMYVGVRPRIPTADHMGCAPRGGPAHKTTSCGARLCSVAPARHLEDILKILRDLIGYVQSRDSCNLLLLSGYLLDLSDL